MKANKITILTTTSTFSAPMENEMLEVIYNPYGRRLTEDEVYFLVKKYKPAGIIAGIEPITEGVMKASGNLKVISRCGIGMDSVDLKTASKLGISVLNTPDEPTDAVAELTVALILSVLRNIAGLDKRVRAGKWKGAKGSLLKGKTVGIIGCGRIGSRVGTILNVFGCPLIGYDPYVKNHELMEMKDMADLIRESDIFSLHIPLTDETRCIISKERIRMMKPSSVLINTARGGLIDEEELYESLLSGRLKGAGLDCFSHEPYSGKLKELDNVVLTPHMGSSTYETRKLMEEKALENLKNELIKKGLL